MKKVLQNLVSKLTIVLKNLALAYMVVQIATNRFPEFLAWLNGLVFSGNAWFSGLAHWCAASVSWVAGVLKYVYAWLPLIGHAALLLVVWRLVCLIVEILNQKTKP